MEGYTPLCYGYIAVYFCGILLLVQAEMSEPPSSPPGQCRERTGFMHPSDFNSIACANCYGYLFMGDAKELRPAGPWLLSVSGPLYSNFTLLEPTVHNETGKGLICATLSGGECERWTQCCEAADKCCEMMAEEQPGGPNVNRTCPATWDGYGCWPQTLPDTHVTGLCPMFIHANTKAGLTHKQCTVNGTWHRDAVSGLEWTDYTSCVSTHIQHFRLKMHVGLACSIGSILVLLPSCIIFLYYRQLRSQHRIQLHLHLFTSFLLSAVLQILWELLIVHDRMVHDSGHAHVHQNMAWCKILFVLTRYSRSTNYLWMFCEAFYLHKLIARAFEPPGTLLIFYLLGWGFPWLPVSVYAIVKVIKDDTRCWIHSLGAWEWVIYVPNLLSLLMNLVFLINILRILVSKLQAHPNEPSNYRRAFKATAVLVPLFGLQLFLVIYRPPYGSAGAGYYEIISSVITHSQGFFVALIFCFLNSEVHHHIKRSLGRLAQDDRMLFNGRGGTQTTQVSDSNHMSESVINKNHYIAMKTVNGEKELIMDQQTIASPMGEKGY